MSHHLLEEQHATLYTFIYANTQQMTMLKHESTFHMLTQILNAALITSNLYMKQTTLAPINPESCEGQKLTKVHYSDPSLSGHSQQRPPCLKWPQIFGATTTCTMNAFTSPSHQRPPVMWPLFLGK